MRSASGSAPHNPTSSSTAAGGSFGTTGPPSSWPTSGGWAKASWTGPRGCHVTVIMTTRREVQSYVDAGARVVTNRSGDVGFQFDAAPGCRKRLRAALAEIE